MKHSKVWRIHKMDYLTRQLAEASADASGISIGEWIDRAILKAKAGTLLIQNRHDSSNKLNENATEAPQTENKKKLQQRKKPIKFRYLLVGIASTIIIAIGIWGITNDSINPSLVKEESKKSRAEDITAAMESRKFQPSKAYNQNPLKNNILESTDVISDALPTPPITVASSQIPTAKNSTQNTDQADTEKYIRKIQTLLNSMNFDAGSENGNLTMQTVKAIQLYQKFSGLEIDGKPSKKLLYDMQAVADAIVSSPQQ